MKHRVLAAIDNSASARPVLDVAVAIARNTDAEAYVLHVSADGEQTARAVTEAHGLALHRATGDVGEVIWKEAEADDVLVTVVGSRGLPTSSRAVGHVALDLITRLDKPVIVVPPDASYSERMSRVLVAVDSSRPDQAPLVDLIDSLTFEDLEVIVVHVDSQASIPHFSDQLQHETEAYAREFLARRFPTLRPVQLSLRIGEPADEMLAACDEVQADLLLVAWKRSLAPGRAPIVRKVLEHARVPVMLTPSAA
ncbi:MAG: universal stress protein [Acidimicrobiia bacterium]